MERKNYKWSQAVYIPLANSLKALLEIPRFLDEILSYMEEIANSKDIIVNIMQCALWNENYASRYKDEIVMPLYIYYDDLECGNPLGSKAGVNNFGVIYFSLACLPPRHAARLDNIIFSTIFYSEDRKPVGNENVLKKIIPELNDLQNDGITVNVSGKKRKVKFQLVLVLGDNLGLNQVCGFVDSFKANFFCRICKISYAESTQLVCEDTSKYRTVENYSQDVITDNVKLTGAAEKCAFNAVNLFHIIINKSIDFMHDMLEGVCAYVIRPMLEAFIFDKNLFGVDEYNDLVQNFHFFPTEGNRPSDVKLGQSKKGKKN